MGLVETGARGLPDFDTLLSLLPLILSSSLSLQPLRIAPRHVGISDRFHDIFCPPYLTNGLFCVIIGFRKANYARDKPTAPIVVGYICA